MEDSPQFLAFQLVQRAAQLLQTSVGTANTDQQSGSGEEQNQRSAIPESGALPTHRDLTRGSITGLRVFAAGESGTSSTSPTVVSEMRRAFMPYQNRPSTRHNTRPGTPSTPRHRSRLATSTFSQKFFCLSGPEDDTSPTTSQKEILELHRLGQSIIRIDRRYTTEELKNSIRLEYPKLDGVEFELMRVVSPGQGRPLTRISRLAAVPTPDIIATARIGIVYIKPANVILDPDIDQETTEAPPRGYETARRQRQARLTQFGTLANVRGASTSVEQCPVPNAGVNRNLNASTSAALPANEQSEGGASGGFDFSNEHSNTDMNGIPASPNAPAAASPIIESLMNETVFTFSGNVEYPNMFTQAYSNGPDGLGLTDHLTVSSFRETLFNENEGSQEIFVSRADFAEEFFGTYKNPRFNFKKKTYVKFCGEPGQDVGAVSKEFFSMGMKTLESYRVATKFPLFEGENDHFVPSSEVSLIGSGLFVFVGKFLAHAAIHTGLAFPGLSLSIVKYVFRENSEDPNLEPIVIDIKDIPDHETRETVKIMQNWIDKQEINEEELKGICTELNFANIFESPRKDNLHFILQQFMEHHVFLVRDRALTEIRNGMKATGLYEFLRSKPDLWENIFPRQSVFQYEPSDLLGIIRYTGENLNDTQTSMEEFLTNLSSEELKSLVECWTGWPTLPLEGLEVAVSECTDMTVHACFNQIEIPKGMPKDELLAKLRMALEYGSCGFGTT